MTKMAKERGYTLDEAAEKAGVKAVTRDQVDPIMDWLRAQKRPTKRDQDREATDAKNAVLRRIKAELDEVHERDGPDAARALIRAQDKKLHGALWGRFKELEPEEQEARA